MGCGFFSLLLRSKSGASWSAPLVHPLTQWLGAAAGADCAWLPVRHGGFWKNFLFYVPLPRYSHMEIWTLPLPSYLSVLRCLGVASGARCIRDACLVQQWIHVLRVAFGEFHIFSTCGALRSWRSSPFRRMEKCAQLMLRVAVSLRAVCTLNLDIISTSSPCDGVG